MCMCEVCVGMDDQLDIAQVNTLNNAQVDTRQNYTHEWGGYASRPLQELQLGIFC